MTGRAYFPDEESEINRIIGVCISCPQGNHEQCPARTGASILGCACPVCGPTSGSSGK